VTGSGGRCGARFSSRRRQWYYVGAELPTAIRALLEQPPPSQPTISPPDDPCTLEEAAAILGLRMREPAADVPPRLFALHDTAYVVRDSPTTSKCGRPTESGQVQSASVSGFVVLAA
jgi:hypothetical protein